MIAWAEARLPIGTWAAATERELPAPGVLAPLEPVSWFAGSGDQLLLLSGATGGWLACDPADRVAIEARWGRQVAPATDPVAELLWRRGVATVGGGGVLDGFDLGAAIEATRQRYTLVLLLSTGCNLACSYCYLGHRQPTPDVAMPSATALAAVDEALRQPWDEVMVDFGEISVSRGRFEELVGEVVRRADAVGKRARVAVQSNATTIDPALADLLAEVDAVVGISLDGPQRLHDRARRFRSGAGSYERVVSSLRLLADRGVSVHLIATVASHNVEHPIDVVEELVSHEPSSFLLKPVLAEGEAGEAWDAEGVSAEAYASFMVEVVAHAQAHGLQYLDQTATKFLQRLLGDRNGWRESCTSRACGSGRSLHVVDGAGRTHACPRFVEEAPPSATVPIRLGRRTPPPATSPVLDDLLPAGLRAAPADCEGCEWLPSCGGGCTLISRDPARPAVPMPDPHCVSYDAVHRALVERILPGFLQGSWATDPRFDGAVVEQLAGSRS